MTAAASCWTTTPAWISTSSGTAPLPTSCDAKVPLQLIMAKTRHKNLRTAMRYVKPGGEVAKGTGILGPSRRRR
jgi:hypothetical protein